MPDFVEMSPHSATRAGLWHNEAPTPKRWHRCQPWSRVTFEGLTDVERCACGAIRHHGGKCWFERQGWSLTNLLDRVLIRPRFWYVGTMLAIAWHLFKLVHLAIQDRSYFAAYYAVMTAFWIYLFSVWRGIYKRDRRSKEPQPVADNGNGDTTT